MKEQQKRFKAVKRAFNKYVKKFGLLEYTCYFEQTEMEEDTFASITVYEEAYVAHVAINTNLSEDAERLYDADLIGKHEAIHLLVHRLTWLGVSRNTSEDALWLEDERLTKLLEKII